MDYKVCILTAGKGTRNKYAQERGINKSLLDIGGREIISYLIDKFPKKVEIVIALGYKGESVKAWTKSLNPNRKLTFIFADYEGRGHGPGWSLLCCKKKLQCPFVYMACDTIVLEDIPEPYVNWMGVNAVCDTLPYLTVEEKMGLVTDVYDKGDERATHIASIGLVGVRDYKAFWEGLEHPVLVQGEHQDTSGLRALIPYGLHTQRFTWYDTGSTEGYERTLKYFNQCVS